MHALHLQENLGKWSTGKGDSCYQYIFTVSNPQHTEKKVNHGTTLHL